MQTTCLTKSGVALWLTIPDAKTVTAYRVEKLSDTPAIPGKAFRLTKTDGTSYDVAVTEFGPACDCHSGTFRESCRHVRALIDMGLI